MSGRFRGVAKIVCKIERWNVQNASKRENNIRMARLSQAVKGIAAIIVDVVIRLRKKSMVTVELFERKRSRCMLMEQAWDEQDASWEFTIKQSLIGQGKHPNNYLKHLFLLKSKQLSLTRSSLTLAIKKQNLSYYSCRSEDTLLFRLARGMGTFAGTYPSHRWPCAESQVVLQWRFRCLRVALVSLGSIWCFGRQDRHLLSRR